ncbi:MAG: hypothetical protein HN509_03420 [Halobacteriovoraceae bacterium]|jgi:hypothetical protein|nr:hypothetical protein [Halobacteriovoraceae bacterium]
MKIKSIILLLVFSSQIWAANKPTDKFEFTYYDVLLMKLEESENDFEFVEFWDIGFQRGGSPSEVVVEITPNPVQERLKEKKAIGKDPLLKAAIEKEEEDIKAKTAAEFKALLKKLNLENVKLKFSNRFTP